MTNLDDVLIIGANGAVGSEIDFGVKIDIDKVDITNKKSIRGALDRYNPKAVMCLASVNLSDCEKNPNLALEVNTLGVLNLAEETNSFNIPLIIITSGAIFDGDFEDKFFEDDRPRPVNIYGKSKYLAELLVRSVNKKHIIVRTGWLFGFKRRNNFFNKIVSKALNNEPINATTDQQGSPTYIFDLIERIKELIKNDSYGTHHVVNEGNTTAYELCSEIVNNLNSKSEIIKISIRDLEKDEIKRSKSEALYSRNIKLRHWKEPLSEILASYKN